MVKDEKKESKCYCPYCDSACKPSFPLCGTCGASIKVCVQCGEVLRKETIICIRCGAKTP